MRCFFYLNIFLTSKKVLEELYIKQLFWPAFGDSQILLLAKIFIVFIKDMSKISSCLL